MKRLRRSTTSTSSTTEEQEGHTPKWRELSSPSDDGDEGPDSSTSTSPPPDFPAAEARRTGSPVISAKCPTCHTTFTSPTSPPSISPASYLLELHFSERHDPLMAVKRDERGEKIYRCFVKECEKVCWEVRKRRWHVEAKHPGFWGEAGKDWSLRGRHSSKREGEKRKGDGGREKGGVLATKEGILQDGANVGNSKRAEGKGDDAMEGLTSGMSSLTFVPPSVRFGRGGKRGGLAKS